MLAALAAGVWLIAGFLVWESRARDPLVDLALFTNPAFTWPTLAATAGTFTLVGVLFVLPIVFIMIAAAAAGAASAAASAAAV